jgi:hypothetical protein
MTEQVLVLGFGQIILITGKVSIVSFRGLFTCSIYIFELATQLLETEDYLVLAPPRVDVLMQNPLYLIWARI